VRKPVDWRNWGEIVYISTHQDTSHWAGGEGSASAVVSSLILRLEGRYVFDGTDHELVI